MAVLAIFVIAPIAIMFMYSFFTSAGGGRDLYRFTSENWREIGSDNYYIAGLLKTFRISGTVAIVSALIGYPAAYFVATMRSRLRWALVIAFLAPFWISFIIRTFSWVSILGDNGVINSALRSGGWQGAPIKLLYSEFSVHVGLVHFVLPYMILNIFVVLDGIDRSLVPAARTLGSNALQAFCEVTLPLSLPGLYVGLFLAFVLAAGSYVTPSILGGPKDFMFGNQIYDAIMAELNWPLGSALSMALLASLSVVSGLFARYVGLAVLYRGFAR